MWSYSSSWFQYRNFLSLTDDISASVWVASGLSDSSSSFYICPSPPRYMISFRWISRFKALFRFLLAGRVSDRMRFRSPLILSPKCSTRFELASLPVSSIWVSCYYTYVPRRIAVPPFDSLGVEWFLAFYVLQDVYRILLCSGRPIPFTPRNCPISCGKSSSPMIVAKGVPNSS